MGGSSAQMAFFSVGRYARLPGNHHHAICSSDKISVDRFLPVLLGSSVINSSRAIVKWPFPAVDLHKRSLPGTPGVVPCGGPAAHKVLPILPYTDRPHPVVIRARHVPAMTLLVPIAHTVLFLMDNDSRVESTIPLKRS